MVLFKRKNKTGGDQNLKMEAVVPRPVAKYQLDQNNHVILLKPKFRSAFLQKYLLPHMKHAYFKIHLDEIGTAVWHQIDGKKNALEIAHHLEAELGDKIQPVYQRLGIFLATMKREKFIDY